MSSAVVVIRALRAVSPKLGETSKLGEWLQQIPEMMSEIPVQNHQTLRPLMEDLRLRKMQTSHIYTTYTHINKQMFQFLVW